MQIVLRPIARKYLERLNEPDKSSMKAALNGLTKEPLVGDIRPLTGQEGFFRLRVGKYRVLFRLENTMIIITNIDPRGQAYKKKNRGSK